MQATTKTSGLIKAIKYIYIYMKQESSKWTIHGVSSTYKSVLSSNESCSLWAILLKGSFPSHKQQKDQKEVLFLGRKKRYPLHVLLDSPYVSRVTWHVVAKEHFNIRSTCDSFLKIQYTVSPIYCIFGVTNRLVGRYNFLKNPWVFSSKISLNVPPSAPDASLAAIRLCRAHWACWIW